MYIIFPCSNTKVWRLENLNNNETSITVAENSLNLSPDCTTERVDIYSGKVETRSDRFS